MKGRLCYNVGIIHHPRPSGSSLANANREITPGQQGARITQKNGFCRLHTEEDSIKITCTD